MGLFYFYKITCQYGWTNGIGLGDGIVASELNNVRGEKKAARRVFETKGCTIKQ